MSLRRNALVQAQRPPRTRLQAVLHAGIGMHAGMSHRDVTKYIALPEELQQMWLEKVGLTPGNENAMTRIALQEALQPLAEKLMNGEEWESRLKNNAAVQTFFMNVCMLMDPSTDANTITDFVEAFKNIQLPELEEQPEPTIKVRPPRLVRQSRHAQGSGNLPPNSLDFSGL
jgi:hypothetical protein